MSKRKRSKIDDTDRRWSTVELIEWARSETISELGIGGYVAASDFCTIYDTMDAGLFAQIMYATEQMLMDYGGEEALNPKNIPATIARHDFRRKPHFHAVADVFMKHLGVRQVSLTDGRE